MSASIVLSLRLCAILAVVLLSLFRTTTAHAAGIPGYPDNILEYDAREVAMLPRYCLYTQDFRAKLPGGDNLAEIERWRAQMGEAFNAMHHYCWGLMETHRAMFLTRDPQLKRHYLSSAVSNYDYVIRSAPRTFVLLPEIYTRKGENLLRLGRTRPGMEALEQAVQLKPDYWPPYAQMSDFYKEKGEAAKARQVLEKGLSQAPQAKPLTRRLAELKTGSKADQ